MTGMITGDIIERAYQLAPEANSLDEIRAQLKKEGFSQVHAHLAGPRIRADLVKLLRKGA